MKDSTKETSLGKGTPNNRDSATISLYINLLSRLVKVWFKRFTLAPYIQSVQVYELVICSWWSPKLSNTEENH